MTTQMKDGVGAASNEMVDWHRIDWQTVNQNVRRLQARIVKATNNQGVQVSKPRLVRGV